MPYIETINYHMLSINVTEHEIDTPAIADFNFMYKDGTIQNILRYATHKKDCGVALKMCYEQHPVDFKAALKADLKKCIPDIDEGTAESVVVDMLRNIDEFPEDLYYVASLRHFWRRRRKSDFDVFMQVFFKSLWWTQEREGKK